MPSHPFRAPVFRRAHAADRLHPTEDLFDPLADALTHLVTLMAGRAIIDGRGAVFVVLGDMRGDGVFSQGDNELFDVIALIRAQGFTPRRLCRDRFDHGFCRFPLSGAGGFGHLGGNNQTVAILHQHMPHVRQIGPVILALAVEPCIGIGYRLVSGVGEFLPVEIDLIVAPWGGPSFGRKLLIEAQASIRVPSTVKCSFESNPFLLACFRTAAKN